MERLFTISFYYRGKPEHCTIEVQETSEGREFMITVMNGVLERLLFGNHIFKERSGKLQIDLPSQNSDLARLKCAIGYALSAHLREQPVLSAAQQN